MHAQVVFVFIQRLGVSCLVWPMISCYFFYLVAWHLWICCYMHACEHMK